MTPNPNYVKHPAYGMVAFHRIQGNPGQLFGSHLDSHEGYIRLEIKEGAVDRSLHNDYYSSTTLSSIVTVDLSAAQFAALLTTMNVGDGVPCTIARRDGKMVERLPRRSVTEQQKMRKEFKETITESLSGLRKNESRLDELLNKKGALGVKDRKEIRELYKSMIRHLESNAKFSLDMFTEATEKVVTEAKANIDNFVTGTLTKLGLEALTDRFKANTVLKDTLGASATVDEAGNLLPSSTK